MVAQSVPAQVDDEAHKPERTAHVVWPIPTSKVSTNVGEVSAVDQSVKTADPEADAQATGNKDDALQLPATKLISTSEASTVVKQISAHAEGESVKTADPQTDSSTTSGTESLPQKPERAIRLFTTPWALVVSLLLGLPAASVLAWLVMKEEDAGGKQITRKRLDLAASRRQRDVLNHHREARLDR
jgi:hypothetical protein